MAAMPLRDEEIEYPTSDGRPMAESNLHRKVMADLIAALDTNVFATCPAIRPCSPP